MKMHWFSMTALSLLAVPAGLALQKSAGSSQDPSTPGAFAPKGRLTKVADADQDKDGAERFDQDSWRKRLGASDIDERLRAFDELAALAARNRDARKAVEEWSKDGKDSDLAWTSRLLLREVGNRPFQAFQPRGRPRGWTGLGGMNGGMNPDLDDFAHRFDDLDSTFGDLRSQWDEMLNSMPTPSAGPLTGGPMTGGGSTLQSSSRSMSLEVGPDGVTAKVTEKVDGKDETHTYTAGSVDELLEAHPELRDSLGTGIHVFGALPRGGMQIFPRGLSGTHPRVLLGDSDPLGMSGDESGEPRTDRLGIQCRDVEKDQATKLGLESGVGLYVEQVVPGTIASLLGLKHGDVVIEVNGAAIHGTEDVKKALHDRAASADVSVAVVGSDGRKRTMNWKPNPPDARGEKPDTKSGSRKL